MLIVIKYEGETYISKEIEGITREQLEEEIWSDLEVLNKFKMELHDGSLLMLGSEAVQKMVFMVKESQPLL